MLDKITTVHILVFLYILAVVGNYFHIPTDNSILAALLVAMNVNNTPPPLSTK